MTQIRDGEAAPDSAELPARRRSRPGDAGAQRKPPRSGWRRELWEWARALLIALVLVLLLRTFVFQLSTVRSYSMEPTLYEQEWLFVNKLAYSLGHPQRGDVVILKDPRDGPDRKEFLVKRVIGGPGDTVEIRGGQLYVNGALTVEPYTDSPIEDGDLAPVRVAEGNYFVMGDNRRAGRSSDSRAFGLVPEREMIGRAEWIIWPIARWDRL